MPSGSDSPEATPQINVAAVAHQSFEFRDLFEKIDALWVKHADDWMPILKAWWSVYPNPLFQLMALRLFLDPRRPEAILPSWLRTYVHALSDNIVAGAFGLDSRAMPSVLGRATGLVLQRRKVVAEALELWESPVLLAVYDDLCKHASVRARSKWALDELRKEFSLQSGTAATERLTKARTALRAVLIELGRPHDTASISGSAAEWLPVWVASMELQRMANVQDPSPDSLAASFGVRPRNDAMFAALSRLISR